MVFEERLQKIQTRHEGCQEEHKRHESSIDYWVELRTTACLTRPCRHILSIQAEDPHLAIEGRQEYLSIAHCGSAELGRCISTISTCSVVAAPERLT